MGVERDDLSYSALFRPQPAYEYFSAAHTFEATRDYSAANAWWLAESSLLVYNARDVINANLEDVTLFAERSTHALVATRGDVHSGFTRALDRIWADVVDHLAGHRAWFCGHSLGGALATLAAARYPAAEGLYTYGSPRVGNKAFAGSFDVPAWRFVNNNDFVVHLPPPRPYMHVGRLKYFDADGVLHDEPSVWDRVQHMALGHRDRAGDTARRWLSGDFSTIANAAVIDHSARLYAERTRQQL